MEEKHEKTMEELVEKSEALQAEITSEQNEVQEMVKDMEQSIESLHQKKENLENELTLRIESVNESTKESKRELQQELNKARFSKAKSRFDKLRATTKESLKKCATVDMITYNVESFTQAAYEAITEPFSDDLLIKQANSPSFSAPTKKGTKKSIKQAEGNKIPRNPSRSKLPSPRAQSRGITRQTSSSSLQGKVISPREILL
jgi:dGTP triphosphohydrolase